MAEAVYLPKIGMTMEDAVLTRWLVPDGTTVSRGDPIFEMDIEKVLQEVEAEAAGILRYLVGDCVRLRPGAVVACLLAAGEEIPAALLERVASQWNEPADEYREVGVTPVVPSAAATADAAPSTAAPASQPAPASEAAPPATPTPAVSSGGRVVASPFARRLAGQLGVDLEQVQGTGPHGRVTEADVRALADAPSTNGAEAPAAASGPAEGAAAGGRVVASPFARRLAGQLGVDLERVQGTGPHGRITEADVRALADAAPATPAAPDVTAPATEVLASAIREAESVEAGTVEAIPYSGRRRAIGERMAQSLRDSAQLTLTSEIRVDDAVRMASGLSREWRADRTVVTLTTLVIRAAARALLEHPRLNSRLDGGQIVSNEAVNIGFAADAAEGLMVPVIRDAAARPLQDVAADFVTLSRRTEANELTAFDVTDATFTVTSLESTEIDAFTPIINPPQAAILGIGRVRRQPVAVDDRIEVGQVTTLSLTIDHRISDGAPAARFLGRVAQLLERPYLLM
jgi:pyruvate dehydrogenase E2 component (dihydrolipoamide acetyltransferase)